jgi:hypothetical protein
MDGTVYKLWMVRPREAFYQLSPAERAAVGERARVALRQVGGSYVVTCNSSWCSEAWTAWGVERFPSIQAIQEHARLLEGMDALRYYDVVTLLGTPGE